MDGSFGKGEFWVTTLSALSVIFVLVFFWNIVKSPALMNQELENKNKKSENEFLNKEEEMLERLKPRFCFHPKIITPNNNHVGHYRVRLENISEVQSIKDCCVKIVTSDPFLSDHLPTPLHCKGLGDTPETQKKPNPGKISLLPGEPGFFDIFHFGEDGILHIKSAERNDLVFNKALYSKITLIAYGENVPSIRMDIELDSRQTRPIVKILKIFATQS